jgi:hypothetical protein
VHSGNGTQGSEAVDFHDRLRVALWSLLGQIMADASTDGLTPIFPAELLTVEFGSGCGAPLASPSSTGTRGDWPHSTGAQRVTCHSRLPNVHRVRPVALLA